MVQLRTKELRRIHLTLDGKPVLARRGQTILEVAREYGVDIPTLCYSQKLRPLGTCRMCLVEVDGTTVPVTSCTTPVSEGMVVRTSTQTLENLRRENLKLILTRHPFNCASCDINGSCELQDLAYRYDISHQDLHAYQVKPADFGETPWATPLITYHPRRCILCGRCVSACSEIAEVGVLAYKGRGANTIIAGTEPNSYGRECISCGECLASCPVDALTETHGQARGKAWEKKRVRTVCTYCGTGCELTLNVVGNRVTHVSPAEGGINNGALCSKGRFGYGFINHKDRLRNPMIRRNGYWEEVNWDEALDFVADKFTEIKLREGADALAGMSSARCTNEENYLFQKLFRGVLGTNNVDHCARL